MLRAMLLAVTLALFGCGDDKMSHQEALEHCASKVADDYPKADFDEIDRHIGECMAAQGWDY